MFRNYFFLWILYYETKWSLLLIKLNVAYNLILLKPNLFLMSYFEKLCRRKKKILFKCSLNLKNPVWISKQKLEVKSPRRMEVKSPRRIYLPVYNKEILHFDILNSKNSKFDILKTMLFEEKSF